VFGDKGSAWYFRLFREICSWGLYKGEKKKIVAVRENETKFRAASITLHHLGEWDRKMRVVTGEKENMVGARYAEAFFEGVPGGIRPWRCKKFPGKRGEWGNFAPK